MGYMSGGVPSFPGFSLSQELVGWLESMTTGWWGERAGGMAGWIVLRTTSIISSSNRVVLLT